MITIHNLYFRYKKKSKDVLQGIDLKIESSTINLLLGLNGCGKTTLLKCIAGLLKVKEDTILIDNLDVVKLNDHKRSKLIAYVSQNQNLISDHTVLNYLLLGFTNTLKFYESNSKQQYDVVYNFAKEFNIEELLNKELNELSGGQRQIVSICKALIQDSPIILLDEPTSALDLKNQNLVLTTLQNIVNKSNKTIILTAHNPNYGLFLNCNVILMNNGEITDNNICTSIINKDKLKTIYGEKLCYSNEQPYEEVSYLNDKKYVK